MHKIDRPEAARRLARASASDIAVYNEALIQEGIQKDTLFELLRDKIESDRRNYEDRVSEEILATTNFFDRALVDIILKPRGTVDSDIW